MWSATEGGYRIKNPRRLRSGLHPMRAQERLRGAERSCICAGMVLARYVVLGGVLSGCPLAVGLALGADPVSVDAAPSQSPLAAVQAAADALRALPLSGPSHGKQTPEAVTAVVSAQLVAKARAMLSLERLVGAVGASDPQRVDVLLIYAEALEGFAADLSGSYVPAYLRGQERDAYRAELAERAVPHLRKALQVWQLVVSATERPEWGNTHAAAVKAVARLEATVGPKPKR